MTQQETTHEQQRSPALLAVAWAFGALALVGVVLATSLWLLLPRFYPELQTAGASGTVAREFPADRFQAIAGRQIQQHEGALTVGALENDEAIFAVRESFQADDLSVARLALSGVRPDLTTELYWSTADAPGRYFQMPLTRGSRSVTLHRLADREGWRGRIVELGVVVHDPTGSSPATSIRLESLALEPATRSALARLTWQDWSTFAPWTQSAMNHYRGASRNTPILPVPVAAAWLLGSLVVLIVAARLARWNSGRLVTAAIAVALVPWLALDGLWQSRLADQVELTGARFGGLSASARHGRELDADLRLQARQVLAQLEPLRGKRLFLVHDSRGHQYFRLRAQYHLLPLNVFNFGRGLPDPSDVRVGDYLLVLDGSEQVRFDAGSGTLVDGQTAMPARRLQRLPRMTLYRLGREAGR